MKHFSSWLHWTYLWLVSPAASALDVMNLQGIMHRDLKPGNILLCYPPDIKVKKPSFDLIKSKVKYKLGNCPIVLPHIPDIGTLSQRISDSLGSSRMVSWPWRCVARRCIWWGIEGCTIFMGVTLYDCVRRQRCCYARITRYQSTSGAWVSSYTNASPGWHHSKLVIRKHWKLFTKSNLTLLGIYSPMMS